MLMEPEIVEVLDALGWKQDIMHFRWIHPPTGARMNGADVTHCETVYTLNVLMINAWKEAGYTPGTCEYLLLHGRLSKGCRRPVLRTASDAAAAFDMMMDPGSAEGDRSVQRTLTATKVQILEDNVRKRIDRARVGDVIVPATPDEAKVLDQYAGTRRADGTVFVKGGSKIEQKLRPKPILHPDRDFAAVMLDRERAKRRSKIRRWVLGIVAFTMLAASLALTVWNILVGGN